MMLKFKVPLGEIIADFFDKLNQLIKDMLVWIMNFVDISKQI